MKRTESLFIQDQSASLISSEITVGFQEVGSAVFVVSASHKPEGACRYLTGFEGVSQRVCFEGEIRSAIAEGSGIWRLHLKQSMEVLDSALSLKLRHPNASEVLEAIAFACGIPITYDLKHKAGKRLPHFAALGTARAALNLALNAFGVKNGCWTPLRNGCLYWGSYDDSAFASGDAEVLPPQWNLEMQDGRLKTWAYPFLPGTRLKVEGKELMIQRCTLRKNNALLELCETQTNGRSSLLFP